MSDQEEAQRAFRYTLNSSIDKPGILSGETLVVHPGPYAWKAAKLLTIGDKETGAVSRQQFRVEQYARDFKGGYSFGEKPERSWLCEGPEADALRAFLNDQVGETGTWVRVDDDSLPSAVLGVIRSGVLSADGIVAVLRMLAEAPDLADGIAASDGAVLLANLVQQRKQRAGLDALHDVVMKPDSTETDIQRVLDNNWWVFGSQYIAKESRRRLTILDTPWTSR